MNTQTQMADNVCRPMPMLSPQRRPRRKTGGGANASSARNERTHAGNGDAVPTRRGWTGTRLVERVATCFIGCLITQSTRKILGRTPARGKRRKRRPPAGKRWHVNHGEHLRSGAKRRRNPLVALSADHVSTVSLAEIAHTARIDRVQESSGIRGKAEMRWRPTRDDGRKAQVHVRCTV